jgi:hypothetical protein
MRHSLLAGRRWFSLSLVLSFSVCLSVWLSEWWVVVQMPTDLRLAMREIFHKLGNESWVKVIPGMLGKMIDDPLNIQTSIRLISMDQMYGIKHRIAAAGKGRCLLLLPLPLLLALSWVCLSCRVAGVY